MGLLELAADWLCRLRGCDPVPLPGSDVIVCSRCRRALAYVRRHHVELTGEEHHG